MDNFARKLCLTVSWTLLMVTIASAELDLKSVTPTMGTLNQSLDVTLTGTGFDGNTRISMSPDIGNKRMVIGSLDTSNALSVSVEDGKAYVADGEKGLQIIDIRDPKNLSVTGVADTDGTACGVTVINKTAFIADGSYGLQIIDASDPFNPRLAGHKDTPGYAHSVAVTGNTAYVADGLSGLQIINITDPEKPYVTGFIDTPGDAREVKVTDNVAYVADYYSGLRVIDVSDSSNPTEKGFVLTPGEACGVAVNGDTAYVADGQKGLQIIDISKLTVIRSVYTPGLACAVKVKDNIAYVADSFCGLQVVDVSDPYNPILKGTVETPGMARDVEIIGNIAYVADKSRGLQVIDASDTSNPVVGSVETAGYAYSVTISDSIACVADGSALQIINVSDFSNPVLMDSVNMPGTAYDVTIVGNYAYVADGTKGLQVVDISNPPSSSIAGSTGKLDYAQGIAVKDNIAYVADGQGLQVIDISNPPAPLNKGGVNTPGEALSVAISGNYAYVADGSRGLQIIDISTPSSPKLKKSVEMPEGYSYDVTILGNTAYMANGGGGLQIVDISTPLNPEKMGCSDTASARGVFVTGNTAYVADRNDGIQVIDVSDSFKPVPIDSVNTLGSAEGVFVIRDIAYVANGYSGLTIMPVPAEVPPGPVQSRTRLSFSLPGPSLPGHYTLKVFNENENDELPGAVTFSDNSPNLKAVIIAGSGPYPGHTLWPDTLTCVKYAYKTLVYQGFTRDNICFLSPDINIDADDDGINDVDDIATREKLSDAGKNLTSDPDAPADLVLIYMTGHGTSGSFLLNGLTDPLENISPEFLKEWLDELQQNIPVLIFIYDACQSGSFLDPLKFTDSKKRRIVIASASDNQDAVSLQGGKFSFSYLFWASVMGGAALDDAFIFSRDMLKDTQKPLLDADGDGIENESVDYNIASEIVTGRGYQPLSDRPYIKDVSVTSDGETSATLEASVTDADGIEKVWAIITWPCYNEELLPEVDLEPDGNGNFHGVYDNFTSAATYNITFYAMDKKGVYSLPEKTTVTQTKGTACVPGEDLFDI